MSAYKLMIAMVSLSLFAFAGGTNSHSCPWGSNYFEQLNHGLEELDALGMPSVGLQQLFSKRCSRR